jgi:hypothetical protein
MNKKFSDQELTSIIEEALIYMCACPAQVAEQVRHLRGLHAYQVNCEQLPDTESIVHQTIAQAAAQAHEIMENCMEEILRLEGWDRKTLKMPEGLRKLRDDLVQGN